MAEDRKVRLSHNKITEELIMNITMLSEAFFCLLEPYHTRDYHPEKDNPILNHIHVTYF